MARHHNYRFLSSFLLWFVALLIGSYLVLFILVRYLVAKPNSEFFGSLMIMLNEAVVQVAEGQGASGIAALNARNAKKSESFQLLPNDPATREPTLWHYGFRIAQQYVSENSDGDTTLRIIDGEKLSLWLSDKRHPGLAIRLEHKRVPFTKIFTIISIVVILLTCSIAAWLITRRITNPLWELAEQAKQLADNKDLTAISFDEKKSLPEIATLTHALNQMRAELNSTIDDREHLLADVTHDLRTPLSRLQIALDILEPSNPAAVKSMLEDVAEMRLILEQFVELAKLNTEITEPWVEDDLNLLVARIRDQYRRTGVNLRTHLSSKPVVIAFKPIALTRLIYNLVDNACRHGDGNIHIYLTHDQGDVVLTVRNKIIKVTQKTGLTQAFAEGYGKTPTTGLGLKIVQKFAAAHRASFVESDEDGFKTFSLRIKSDLS